MDKETKEKKIASFLRTDKGKDRLGMAIVEGMYGVATKPGTNQILAQAVLDSWSKGRTRAWWNKK